MYENNSTDELLLIKQPTDVPEATANEPIEAQETVIVESDSLAERERDNKKDNEREAVVSEHERLLLCDLEQKKKVFQQHPITPSMLYAITSLMLRMETTTMIVI